MELPPDMMRALLWNWLALITDLRDFYPAASAAGGDAPRDRRAAPLRARCIVGKLSAVVTLWTHVTFNSCFTASRPPGCSSCIYALSSAARAQAQSRNRPPEEHGGRKGDGSKMLRRNLLKCDFRRRRSRRWSPSAKLRAQTKVERATRGMRSPDHQRRQRDRHRARGLAPRASSKSPPTRTASTATAAPPSPSAPTWLFPPSRNI